MFRRARDLKYLVTMKEVGAMSVQGRLTGGLLVCHNLHSPLLA